MEEIGKIILRLRKQREWTQAELAKKLCVSDKAVSKWENGNGLPEISQLPMLTEIFGVSIDYLMTGAETPKKKTERLQNEKTNKNDRTEGVMPENRKGEKAADELVDEAEAAVQSAIHYGILNLDELKNIQNLAVLRQAINKYPVHIFELLYQWYNNKNWRRLFQFAVNNENESFADSILNEDTEAIERNLLEYWFNGHKARQEKLTVLSVIAELHLKKDRFIEELEKKDERQKIMDQLTKDYFYSEFSRGNKALVIVKLCVRLEAILKYDYKLVGDFSTMLDRFCLQFNTTEEDELDYDPYTPQTLKELREQRNNIVFSEKSEITISDDDLQWCIEYICSM